MDEFVIADLLNSEQWSECVKEVKAVKERERLVLFGQLTNYVNDMATFGMPACGLTFWLKFHTPKLLKDYMELLPAMGRPVPFMPFSKRPDDHIIIMRLGFGSFDPAEVEDAGKKMRDKFNNNLFN